MIALRWVTLVSVFTVAIVLIGTVATLGQPLSNMAFAAVFLLVVLSLGFVLQSGMRQARSLNTPYW